MTILGIAMIVVGVLSGAPIIWGFGVAALAIGVGLAAVDSTQRYRTLQAQLAVDEWSDISERSRRELMNVGSAL